MKHSLPLVRLSKFITNINAKSHGIRPMCFLRLPCKNSHETEQTKLQRKNFIIYSVLYYSPWSNRHNIPERLEKYRCATGLGFVGIAPFKANWGIVWFCKKSDGILMWLYSKLVYYFRFYCKSAFNRWTFAYSGLFFLPMRVTTLCWLLDYKITSQTQIHCCREKLKSFFGGHDFCM